VSRYRPELPIVVATTSERVCNQLGVSWGVEPYVMKECKTVEKLIDQGVKHLKKEKMVKEGDKIIVVAGEPVSGGVNRVEVKEIE
jgi:pyruvate kinase